MEALTTMTGNVGGDVDHRLPEGVAAPVASFSLAVTPRLRRGDVWVDSDTTWVRVVCWRGLADRVRESVRRGDAVIVVGRLRTERWVNDRGEVRERLAVDATTVGHDLSRGTARFTRASRLLEESGPLQQTPAEAAAAELADLEVERVDAEPSEEELEPAPA